MLSTGCLSCQLHGLPRSYERHSDTDMQGDADNHGKMMCCVGEEILDILHTSVLSRVHNRETFYYGLLVLCITPPCTVNFSPFCVFGIRSCCLLQVLLSMLQLHKLMVYDPEEQSLSGAELQHFQELWANNGDAISRQYTGTDALKVQDKRHYFFQKMITINIISCKQ